MCMYEESTHVQLAFVLPKGAKQVASSDQLVSSVDILPTICDLIDVPCTQAVEGISLKLTIEHGTTIDRDRSYVQFEGNGARGNFQRSIVEVSHKLIVDLFKDEVFFDLYDVIADTQEKYNLAFKEQMRVRELSDHLIA